VSVTRSECRKLLVVGGFLPFAAESVLDNGGYIAGCFDYLACFGSCNLVGGCGRSCCSDHCDLVGGCGCTMHEDEGRKDVIDVL
jgi:hypothetical protein